MSSPYHRYDETSGTSSGQRSPSPPKGMDASTENLKQSLQVATACVDVITAAMSFDMFPENKGFTENCKDHISWSAFCVVKTN